MHLDHSLTNIALSYYEGEAFTSAHFFQNLVRFLPWFRHTECERGNHARIHTKIELRIAEAGYLAVTLPRRNSDAPAVMHMLHCAGIYAVQFSEVCTDHWRGKGILAMQNTQILRLFY